MGKKAEERRNKIFYGFVFKIISIELSDQIRIKSEFEKPSRSSYISPAVGFKKQPDLTETSGNGITGQLHDSFHLLNNSEHNMF